MAEVLEKADFPEEETEPSRLEEAEQLRTLKAWFKDDSRHSSEWRKEATEDFDFVGGDQLSPEDKQYLKDQMRPIITFNYTLTMVKAVAGMEINGRHEISFIPRNQEDAKVDELLSGASKWMADNCDGEDEESEAFQKTIICGMGWNEHRMDYEDVAEGKYIEESIDPLEMFWDCSAKKKNLVDARRMHRARKMPMSDAKHLFPGFTRDELDATWANSDTSESFGKSREEKRIRDDGSSGNDQRIEVTIVECRWYEREKYWLVADEAAGKKINLSVEEYETLTDRLAEVAKATGKEPPALQAVEMTHRVYKRAFLGSKVLEISDGPVEDHFGWTCITGEINHNRRTWYGLVRLVRDPQMWANKWLSQSLHILNTTAKGGIIAEPDAFEDQAQAEATYARPDAITWASRKAISDQKIMAKPGAAFPTGHIELMKFAIDALRSVSGINLELLGQKDVNQPGVLEAHRKQAAMTILATLFDSLRRARKEIGRIRLYFIQNFLSDGRLVRIVGQDGIKTLPLLKDRTVGEYDVIVDDTPTSPNQKQANWAVIQPMLVAFRDLLVQRPDLLLMWLEYSPLPQRLIEATKEAMKKQTPEEQRNKALKEADVVAGIAQKQSVAEKNNADAGATQATAVYDIAMARKALTEGGTPQNPLADNLDALKTAAEIKTEHAKAENVAAQTDAERADAMRSRVATVKEALTPIQPPAPRGPPDLHRSAVPQKK